MVKSDSNNALKDQTQEMALFVCGFVTHTQSYT